MKLSLETLNNNIEKARFIVKKNSPLIMTITGIIGLGVTAKTAYDSRDKVRLITEELERRKAAGEEISPVEVATRVGKAVALPVATGTLSVMSILGSYHVLSGRIGLLSTALNIANQENQRMKRYIKENHPEVKLAPVQEQQQVLADPSQEGKKKPKMVDAVKKSDVTTLEGVWYDKSTEYAGDNTEDSILYNQMNIETQARILSNKLMQRGYLTLADVWGALNIPSSEVNYSVGARLGWTDVDYFDLEVEIIQVINDAGYPQPVPYVSWPAPRAIAESIDWSRGNEEFAY